MLHNVSVYHGCQLTLIEAEDDVENERDRIALKKKIKKLVIHLNSPLRMLRKNLASLIH
jgi:hypothetical protein